MIPTRGARARGRDGGRRPDDRGPDGHGDHLPRAPFDTGGDGVQRLADVHHELVALAGTPPFQVGLGDDVADAVSFAELRAAILEVAQKGIDYYRFKGLGEMDPRSCVRRRWIPHRAR